MACIFGGVFLCASPKSNKISPTENPMNDDDYEAFLQEYYHEFKCCHLAHIPIALYRLGASSARTRAVLDHAAKVMEQAGEMKICPTPSGSWINKIGGDITFTHVAWNSGTPESLMGAEKSYHTLLRHYKDLLHNSYGGNFRTLLSWEFPKLHKGIAGGVMHGLIHTGYGAFAGKAELVCEGLAYLHNSHCPMEVDSDSKLTTLGGGDKGILDVFIGIKQDQMLLRFVKTESRKNFEAYKDMGPFQKRIALLLAYKSGRLLDYVHQLKFPNCYHENHPQRSLQPLSKWLVDCSIMIFLASSKPNNFFLLHGITSSWALAEVLPCLSRREDVMAALRVQLCLLLATYLAEEAPELDINLLGKPNVDGLSWEDIKRSTLGLSVEADTHICKVVQICRESSTKNSDANMEKIYKRASMVVITKPSTNLCPTKFSILQETKL